MLELLLFSSTSLPKANSKIKMRWALLDESEVLEKDMSLLLESVQTLVSLTLLLQWRGILEMLESGLCFSMSDRICR